MDENTKSIWLSKTVWMSILTAAAPLYPPVGAFVSANPAVTSFIVGAVFTGLRFVTDTKVVAKKKK